MIKKKKQGTYVEVKIAYAKHLLDLNTASSRKYAKWWQQCFLAGINHMLLGFRNDYGIVEYLQPLGVKDIEIRAKTWSASAFISFLDEFCSFVRRIITKDWSYKDKKKKSNGVYQMICNTNFYLIGLSMNFLEIKKKQTLV